MKIIVWSKNPAKVDAVKEIISDYNFLKWAEVVWIETESWVSDQPKSLDEIVKWAKNRAKAVFENCDYSFGIENWLMKVPETKTGYMDIWACVIYDWKEFHIWLSSAFEYPQKVIDYAFDKWLNISQAFFKAWLTKDENLWYSQWAIWILTRWRLIRKESIKQAVRNALIHLDK
jgi:inosine/xanthosine triphosphatase